MDLEKCFRIEIEQYAYLMAHPKKSFFFFFSALIHCPILSGSTNADTATEYSSSWRTQKANKPRKSDLQSSAFIIRQISLVK